MTRQRNKVTEAGTVKPYYKGKRIDVSKAIELKFKGCTYREIAQYFNCDHTLVLRALKPYFGGFEGDLSSYVDRRADVLAGVQARALQALTDAKLKGASARDLAVMYGILFDKERLERGKSTQNIETYEQRIIRQGVVTIDDSDLEELERQI